MRRSISIFCLSLVVISVSFGISGCKESLKDLYQKAMKEYRTENYQGAAQTFEEILQKYPEHNLTRKARYELGKIYFYKLKQPHKALKHLQDLYAQSQSGKYSLEALKLIGSIYDRSLNDCLKGVEVYRILLRDYASDIDAGEYQYGVAECYFKLHDYVQANREYQMLIEQYPKSQHVPQSKFQIANTHALQEEWDKAIELHKELLLSEGISDQLIVDSKLELAFCHEREERYEKALTLYQELQEIDPNTVVIDARLLARKIDRVKELIKQSKQGPQKVEWKRKK